MESRSDSSSSASETNPSNAEIPRTSASDSSSSDSSTSDPGYEETVLSAVVVEDERETAEDLNLRDLIDSLNRMITHLEEVQYSYYYFWNYKSANRMLHLYIHAILALIGFVAGMVLIPVAAIFDFPTQVKYSMIGLGVIGAVIAILACIEIQLPPSEGSIVVRKRSISALKASVREEMLCLFNRMHEALQMDVTSEFDQASWTIDSFIRFAKANVPRLRSEEYNRAIRHQFQLFQAQQPAPLKEKAPEVKEIKKPTEPTFEDRLKKIEFEGEIDKNFICSISQAIMNEPILLDDCQHYDKKSIEQLLACNPDACCPMDKNKKITLPLRHDYYMKEQIEIFVKKQEDLAKTETPPESPQPPAMNQKLQ
jgi:hypothetical protein